MKLPALVLFTALLTACAGPLQVHSLTDLHQPEAQNQLLKMNPDLAKDLMKQETDIPMLVEFSANWCKPCQALKRPLWQLAEKSQGRYRVVEVDVTADASVLKDFGLITSLPAFILRIPGSKNKVVRYGGGDGGPFDQLSAWLQDSEHMTSIPLPLKPMSQPQAFKAMLIAGSADNANFLQELLWNYSWLLQRGFKDEDIGCFYGRPDVLQYSNDRKQFDQLTDIISHCQPNNRKVILESLKLSLQNQPKDFYLYVSSHGAAPVADKLKDGFKKSCVSFAPSLVLDQQPADCESERGLIPEDLAAAMKVAPNTNKYLILQGCYTGGFISNQDDPKTDPSPLAQVPRVRIMTASTAQHASFGCDPGGQSTFFGYAYGMEIIKEKNPMDSINWVAIHNNVSQRVKKLEAELPRRVRGSDPQYFAN